jgi:hypothetical protein
MSGVLASRPAFGDERRIADTLTLAALNVPVLVQASPDDLEQLSVERRDSICGKIPRALDQQRGQAVIPDW